MKTRAVDFHHVDETHKAIDDKLRNWAAWVEVRIPSWTSPIWKLGRSQARQWHAPELRPECDILDAMKMEKAVFALPEKHRNAIRWCYVYKYGEDRFRKKEGHTREGLAQILHQARQMLENRAARKNQLTHQKTTDL